MSGSLLGPYRLRPILLCSVQQQEAVRSLRNEPSVRSAMYADHVISVDEHQRWLKGLDGDDRRAIFVVLGASGGVAGLASLTAIDRAHRTADWGFYMGPSAPVGLGSAVLSHVIGYAFGSLGLEKINGEVIEGNAASLGVHHKLLFQVEGFRRSQVRREGGRLGVHLLGLTLEDWRKGAPRLAAAKHEVAIDLAK
jgi:UDP-4-amino-4,6-dideoxy-N-acetyl-beta-L-altrosamine N-acetyltransferase